MKAVELTPRECGIFLEHTWRGPLSQWGMEGSDRRAGQVYGTKLRRFGLRLACFWPWPTGSSVTRRKPAASYDKSVEWMEKHKPADEELKRFRAEAAELLGIAEEPDQTDAPGVSDEKEKPPTEGSEEKPNGEVKQDENEK